MIEVNANIRFYAVDFEKRREMNTSSLFTEEGN